MKNIKSRTVVGRTIARVKSRIASLGSAAPALTNNPNPLVVPQTSRPAPPSLDGPTIVPSPTTPTPKSKGKEQDAVQDNKSLLPRISTLQITPSTWTIFNNPAHPKYPATAYIQFTMTCHPQNAARPHPSPALSCSSIISPLQTKPLSHVNASVSRLASNPPGLLLHLNLALTTTGPHAQLQSFGDTTVPCLGPGGSWVYVLHLAVKDTSLASKLSTSFRNLRKSASRSLKRYNIDVIDRWLDVLNEDKSAASRREEVVVHARVRYQHSFLPNGESGTWLEDTIDCKVNMRRGEGQAGLGANDTGMDGAMEDSEWAGKEMVEDEELDLMEEMVREHNVQLGPPFML